MVSRDPVLPRAQSALIGNGANDPKIAPSREWHDFFRALLARVNEDSELHAELAAIVARLDTIEGTDFEGLMSVQVIGSLSDGLVQFMLRGDLVTPEPLSYYGAGPLSEKGWWPGSSLIEWLVDESGNYLTDQTGNYLIGRNLADVLVAGGTTGQFLRGDNVYSNDLEGPLTIRGALYLTNLVTVTALADFPAPVAGVITLAANTCYQVTAYIDMLGNRIVGGTNSSMVGFSPDSSGLFFTAAGDGSPKISSTTSLDMRYLTLSAPVGTLLDLNDGSSGSLGWYGMRIFDTPTIGAIQNYANIVTRDCQFVNSANLTLTGTIASFVSETSLWDCRAGQTLITLPASAIITRRVRFLYCAFVVASGETGINFSSSASVGDESYILDNVNFSGGGTYLAGLDHTSNKASFFRCVGITNSNAICSYYMLANATATVISSAGTFVKVAGTTSPGSLNQKFTTAVTNRAVYAGSVQDAFRVVGFATMTSGNNQTLRLQIAKNGVPIPDSTARFKTTGSGDASCIGCQSFVTLAPGDYVELWATNDTAANNITVTDLSLTVTRLN